MMTRRQANTGIASVALLAAAPGASVARALNPSKPVEPPSQQFVTFAQTVGYSRA